MKSRSRLLLRALAAGAALTVLAWAIVRLGPREVLAVALQADPTLLLLSVLALVARFLIWAFKWTRMLRRERPMFFRDSLRMLMAGFFINLTTPTAKLGGGVLRAALLCRNHGWTKANAAGWVLADQITNNLGGMLLFGLLALGGGLFAPVGSSDAYMITGAAGVGLFTVVLLLRNWFWKATEQPWLISALTRITPARFREGRGDAAAAGWLRPLARPLLQQSHWTDVLAASASFGSLCAANTLVLRALGVDAALWIVAVAVAIGYLAGNGLGPWGGIGVTEVAMAAIYIQLGVPGEAAAAGVLLHRSGYYLVGLLWGGVALLRTGRPLASRAGGV